MKNRFRRTFTLFALTFVLTVSLAAQAGPLPMPLEPQAGPVVMPSVDLLSPPDGVTVSYDTLFTWSNPVTPDKYILKLRIPATGKVLSYNVPLDNCVELGVCTFGINLTPLFDHLQEGDAFTWRIISKINDNKAKSSSRTLFANTVSAPANLLPADGGALNLIQDLSWAHSRANQSYTLVVRYAETGVLVTKVKMTHDQCVVTCIYDIYDDGLLPEGTPFSWVVRAKGFNGDKSPKIKQIFTPSYIAATR